MGLTAKEKRAATKVTAPRYQKAKKNQKGIILEEFAALTGYNRCYAAYLLRIQGKKRYIDRNTVIVADAGKKCKNLVSASMIIQWSFSSPLKSPRKPIPTKNAYPVQIVTVI